MTVPSVTQLEDIYTRLLRVVHKEVTRLEGVEELAAGDLRSLETVDKVLRASLEYSKLKPVINELSELSDEELLKKLGA